MRARLTAVTGDVRPPHVDLDPTLPATIGRSRDNTLVIRDEHASRLHAKVYFEGGRWFVRDFGLNGTRLDGERIAQAAEIEHGQEIRIGETRIRFTLEGSAVRPAPTAGAASSILGPPGTESGSVVLSSTRLRGDELTALCQFMAGAVEARDLHALLRLALSSVLQQTDATVAGYLSLDPTDPLPKVVLPELAQVDVHLSRHLTRRVQRDGQSVWLGADVAGTQPSDSLSPFTDAVCLLLRAGDQPAGALHVYKANASFAEREVRFAEALAGYLGHALHLLRVRRNLEAENSRLRSHSPDGDDLVGDGPAMVTLRSQIARAAPQQFTVLVEGESGSGKELVALALHRSSTRAGGPLVVVNCAAIPPTLMEAELFGYRKGAFTAADRDYPGLFQQADEGTLFLDEVGELSADCQAKLLRVIEGKSFRPIGATAEVKTDVRIVAATNRNLELEARAGRFRQDLFYRLKVIHLRVPPLREHPEDVPYLVQYFLDKLALECRRPVRLTDAAVRELQGYPWPGNVRQLRALLESAVVMSDSDTLDVDAVRRLLQPADQPLDAPPSLNWDELETWAIRRALKQTNGNVSQAAKVLGLSRDTLHTKIKKKGIERPDGGGAEE